MLSDLAVPGPVASLPEGVTPEYGRYMVSIAACQDCHGETLRGHPPNSPGPPAPDIAGPLATLDFATFDRALRGGVGFRGQALDPGRMPFGEFREMTDLEARAVYAYVRSLKAK